MGCLELLYAVACHHVEKVEKLVEWGADVSVKTLGLEGSTPLEMARNERIAEILSAVDDEDRMVE